MIVRPNASSWQTILADLSLILFMVTASALASAPAPLTPPSEPVRASPRAEPVGVWTDGPGAPALTGWLAEQASDPRQRLSVVVRYTGKRRAAALDRAAALIASAGARGDSARVVVEPGPAPGASVTLGYDDDAIAGPSSLAR